MTLKDWKRRHRSTDGLSLHEEALVDKAWKAALENSAVPDAARALLATLESMAGELNACLQVSYIHGVPYNGTHWKYEFEALKSALEQDKP